MYVGMSAIHRERDDLQTATQLLLRSQELGEHLGLPQNPHRWRVAMARIREAEGDLAGAVTLLDDAKRVYAGDFSQTSVPSRRRGRGCGSGRGGASLARWSRRAHPSPPDRRRSPCRCPPWHR
jgi:LuxR family transcriptional regulator, maltose regulon positive regulatory protein